MPARTALAHVAGLVLACLLAGPAHATSIVARDVDYLATTATEVVRGVVVEVDTTHAPDGTPWTRSTVAVAEVWKGRLDATVDLWQQGGTLPDGTRMHIPGDLTLRPGDEIVAFLHTAPDGRRASLLFGWSVFEVTGLGDDAPVQRHSVDFGLFAPDDKGALAPTTSQAFAPPATVGALRRAVGRTLEAAP